MNKQSRRLSIVFLICLFLFQFPAIVKADELEASPTPTPIEYQLPYPGLLPDHPFYFLKHARDIFLGVLTSGSLNKAEYDLLQSDKNLVATLLLVDKNRSDLAVDTLSESMNYFDDAIQKTIFAKKQGMENKEFVKKLLLANRKHQEIVNGLAKNDQKKFAPWAKKVAEFGKKVKALQPEK